MIVQETLNPLVDRAALSCAMQKGAISSRPGNRSNVASPFMRGFPVLNDSE
jgi:hypothetical protein